MALRITSDLVKFKNLMKDLDLSFYEGIGLLESIWHFTAKNTIRGDIGKHSNQEIADWIGWKKDAGKMIDALTKSGWLDVSEKYRLIVHDWHIHADKSVKAIMRNRKLIFVQEEKLTEVPKEITGVPVNAEWCPSQSAECRVQSADGVAAVNQPASALEAFPEACRQPSLQAAIAYQTRRYGSPNPGAVWHPSLINEIATTFEVQPDPEASLKKFLATCSAKPSLDLPRDAPFSKIAEYCGIKKPKSTSRYDKPSPSGPPLPTGKQLMDKAIADFEAQKMLEAKRNAVA